MSSVTARTEFDVVVIGLGIGGEALAGSLAERGLAVAGVESGLVGGECPYWGCIPSKMMIRAANALAEARRIDGLAGSAVVTPDFAPVAQRIRDEATDNWNDQVAVDRFVGKGGHFLRGHGEIVAPRRVLVTGPDGDRVTISAEVGIVIATGTRAAVPPIPGLHDVDFWTNREALRTENLPRSMTVLGGGAIGLELAQAFSRFGVQVEVVELFDRVLYYEEPEASEVVAAALHDEGIIIHTANTATEVKGVDNEIAVVLADGSLIAAEKLLVATGRRTDVSGLGLDTLGLDPDSRFVRVDPHMRLLDGVGAVVPGMWAVGDITGHGLFTHIAAYEAPIAVASIMGDDHTGADYRALPRVTFTDPEVGAVGQTEAAAREAGINVVRTTKPVHHTARGWMHGAGNGGVIKLVADADRRVLVGATAAGPSGGEVIGLLELAIHAEVPLDELHALIYAYPTFYRGIQDALAELAV